MSHVPKVSVLLPVHNGMPYLPSAIESILQQTLKEFELLVLEDGSTDESAAYLKTLKDPRVQCLSLPRSGLSESLNIGLRKARAPLIARMDGDDLSEPTRLEKQFAFMEAHPKHVLLGADVMIIDAQDRPIIERRAPRTDSGLRWSLVFENPFAHPATMFRREDVLTLGGYQSEWKTKNGNDLAEDYQLWVKLAGRGKLATYPERLLKYRSHAQSVSERYHDDFEELLPVVGGRFANVNCKALPVEQAGDLIAFKRLGKLSDRSDLATILKDFSFLRESCRQVRDEGQEELETLIAETEEQLSRRCLRLAAKSIGDPAKFFASLQAAKDLKHKTMAGFVAGVVGSGARKIGHKLAAARRLSRL